MSLGSKNDTSHFKTMVDSHITHSDTPYLLVDKKSPVVVLPSKYINEVNAMGDSKANFDEELWRRLYGRYTGLGLHQPALIQSVRVDLTRSLARNIEILQEEADFAIPDTIGTCDDWTPINLNPKLLRIIAMLSGRTFVSLPLSRDEEWINSTIKYTVDVFALPDVLREYPDVLLPVIVPFLAQYQRIQKHKATAQRHIKPIIKERIANMKLPGYSPPNDMLTFCMKNSGDKFNDVALQAFQQLLLSMAAIHTTTMLLTHILYDLCAHPECIEPLREELQTVVRSDGKVELKSNMTKLHKMDSVMKESQRLNGLSATGVARFATQDIEFADGLKIAKGTSFCFNVAGPNMNPELINNPEEFDGFRYARLREEPGQENKHQFVTTSTNALNFGHGLHACPGRFFASNETKVALSYILQNYDMRFRDGEKRPKNYYIGVSILADPTAVVEFRRRRAV